VCTAAGQLADSSNCTSIQHSRQHACASALAQPGSHRGDRHPPCREDRWPRTSGREKQADLRRAKQSAEALSFYRHFEPLCAVTYTRFIVSWGACSGVPTIMSAVLDHHRPPSAPVGLNTPEAAQAALRTFWRLAWSSARFHIWAWRREAHRR
jgi:hypothetical protein